jgi:hypothetical protein
MDALVQLSGVTKQYEEDERPAVARFRRRRVGMIFRFSTCLTT